MSKFICDSGTLTLSGTAYAESGLCINNVTIDVNADVKSYQCMGDDAWVSKAAGPKSWTCTFETALDDTSGVDLANTIGESCTLNFDTVDGLAYSGTAIITGVSINAPSEEYATVSWTAEGSGAITEA